MFVKDNIKYWIPLVIWMIVIFTLSSNLFSSGSTEKVIQSGFWNSLFRHTAHIVEYFILYLLFYRAINKGFSGISNIFIIISFFSSFIYAISDEIHQYFVPSRHFRWIDIGFDSIGILLGVAFVYLSIITKILEYKKMSKSV